MTNAKGKSGWRKVLRESDTCWRIETTYRAGVLVESCAYFEALRNACEQAEHSILILGWDFDRRERLGRKPDSPTIEDFLCSLLENQPRLNVYLLSWDYAFVYAAEREWFQELRLRHGTHERLRVKFDGAHPTGGSQHQKIVVIDDRLAFCGGIDISRWRWDTSEHAPDDERRTDPDGKRYPPFHDLMMLVDGPAASALGELARDRWARCGEMIEVSENHANDKPEWPTKEDPAWIDCRIGIARTLPAYGRQSEVREVERLYIDAIERAHEYIYMENQYFTSRVIAEALAKRLAEKGGPDVILVLPRHTGGWLEQVTMDAIRVRRVRELSEADHEGRMRVFYPHQSGLAEGDCISVHAKLMLADDCFLRVGSANTSNRSMGLDSECDLALVDEESTGVRNLLHLLLAEHLDCGVDEIDKARAKSDSLIGAIETLCRSEGRSLRPLDAAAEGEALDIAAEEDVVDPEEPIDSEFLVRRAIPPEQGGRGHRRLYVFLGFIAVLFAVGIGWRWTPLGEWLTAERLASFLSIFDTTWIRFVSVMLVVAVTTLLMVPLTPLVVASSLLLGPWLGFCSSMVGALMSAAAGFIAGHLMGRQLLDRYSGSRMHRLSKRLSDRGVLAVAVLRMVPIAPYAVVNVVAGASHLRLGRFMLGSVIGMVPGVAALSWFSGSLYRAVTEPSTRSLGVLLVATVLIGIGTWLLRRLLKDS